MKLGSRVKLTAAAHEREWQNRAAASGRESGDERRHRAERERMEAEADDREPLELAKLDRQLAAREAGIDAAVAAGKTSEDEAARERKVVRAAHAGRRARVAGEHASRRARKGGGVSGGEDAVFVVVDLRGARAWVREEDGDVVRIAALGELVEV